MYLDLGRLDAADASFRQLRVLNPQAAAGPFGLGRTALARHDYPTAIDHLRSALALDEQSAGIRYSLAMAYRGLGDQARAEEYLRQSGPRGALRLDDPLMQEIDGLLHSSQAYRATAVWTFNRGDRNTSVEYFKKASQLASDEPSLQYEVGVGLFLAGDTPGAIQHFNEALRLSPAFAKAHYGLGIALARQGDTKEAVEHLSTAVNGSPDYLEAQLGLADLLRRLGRFADALAPYEHVIALDPRIPEAWLGYALSLGGAGRNGTARDVLRNAASRFPDHQEFDATFKQLFGAS
jgi:tetratricopeptide (TPR) repeat protein